MSPYMLRQGPPLILLALGIGAGEKWNEHAQTRPFITAFSAKNFGILRGAYGTHILEAGAGKCPPDLITLIIYRKRPPILNGRLDWTAIGAACGIEDEMTAELKKQLRPALDAIIRWLKAPPVAEDVPPAKLSTRTGRLEPLKKTAAASSTRKPQRVTLPPSFIQI